MLTLDVYQGAFLLVTLAVVAWRVLSASGGFAGLAAIDDAGTAGTALPSLIPPLDFEPTSKTFFPMPAVALWATAAGLSWLACNFGTAQRLLASRSERDAQKSLLAVAVLANIACFATFVVGVAMRKLAPDILPDQAFMKVMLEMFPTGVRGLLVAGMMAALLSSADGLLTASGTLLTQDIYLRFIRPSASEKLAKNVTRLLEAGALLAALALIPVVRQAQSAVTFVQDYFGDLLGVVVALYVVGIFSRRATARPALVAMITGLLLAGVLHVLTPLNFAYRGFLSFAWVIIVTLLLSRLEPAPDAQRLENLTVHTLSDVRGPWVGLKAWPGLWKWALGLAVGWFALSGLWEWYIRTH